MNTRKGATYLQRWASKVQLPPRGTNGCWQWIGGSCPLGYGRFFIGGKGFKKYTGPHRFSYETFVGPIPAGRVIDHLCRNPSCVNPDHLEAVTVRENTLRGIGLTARLAQQTHCKRGHELSGDNVRLVFRGNTRMRHCRACQQVRPRPYLERQKAARLSRRMMEATHG